MSDQSKSNTIGNAYGKDNLRKLCDAYGWDANQWDDGRRVN